jgi:hypothetical protein
MTKITKANGTQGVTIATRTKAEQPQDLFSLFQQFMAMQASNATAQPVGTEVVPVIQASSVKSKAKVSAKVATIAPEKQPATQPKGVFIHEMENSFFVYGSDAPEKLAAFFTKKPHLNRGYKEREIKGIGNVKAFWFGGRQIAKVRKAIA